MTPKNFDEVESIDDLENLEANASPAPWWTGSANSGRWWRLRPGPPHPETDGTGEDHYGGSFPGPNPDSDAIFVVALRNEAQELLRLARLGSEVETLREAVKTLRDDRDAARKSRDEWVELAANTHSDACREGVCGGKNECLYCKARHIHECREYGR